MRVQQPFTCRRRARSKPLAILALIAMIASPLGRPVFVTTVHAQVQTAPVGNGFLIDAGDLRFIFKQIQISQAHAAGGQLLGPGPNQVNAQAAPNGNPQLPMGLRTVDGSFNNLVPIPDQHSMTVMGFTGAVPSLVGAASLATSAAAGAPNGTLVTTRANSLVVGVGTDWDSARTMVPRAGQVMVNQFNTPNGDTYWVQRTSPPVAATGTSVTIGDSYGTLMPDRWNLALIEIRKQ